MLQKKNLKLSPLVQLMSEYLEIKTDLKTPKIKTPKIKIKKLTSKKTLDTDSDGSGETVIFDNEAWKVIPKK